MKIFVDFDDVMFDTKRFYLDFQKVFIRNGISRSVVERTNRESRQKNSLNTSSVYSPWRQLELMGLPSDKSRDIKKELTESLVDLQKYVFKDVGRLIVNFHKSSLVILSYGDIKFQGQKIKGSGLTKYFGKIIISKKSKAVVIGKYHAKNGKESIYFLDDRIEHLEEMKKSDPAVTTMLVRRREGRYKDERSDAGDYAIKNLNQAVKIINKIKNGSSR